MFKVLSKLLERMNAAQWVVISFASVILTGAFVLWLPLSTTGEGSISFVDALFTSTSAVCVTGLTVLDTGTAFTPFGQSVILLLIQLGGFGVLTFSTFILFMSGRSVSLHISDAVSGSFLKLRHYSLRKLISQALAFTLLFELAGAFLLFSRWRQDFPCSKAVWLAVFHSISAFNNAGFSLFPDSLMQYAGDLTVNFTIMLQIIFGGIGFFVLIDLWDVIKRHPDPVRRRLSLHTKIVLLMSLLLIPGGALLLYAFEHNHALAPYSGGQAFLCALFQSVTSRTAGFNTLSLSGLTNASLFLLIILMFIGASPGSTGGGVKTITVGVLLIVILSRLRRLSRPSLFGRAISRDNLEQAVTLLLLAMALLVAFILLLLMVESRQVPLSQSQNDFMKLAFEAVSAFGTVGLSCNLTPTLSVPSRLILIFLMFIGRIGPLTLAYALRRRTEAAYTYPEEQIMIG